MQQLYPPESFSLIAAKWRCSRDAARKYLTGEREPPLKILAIICADKGVSDAWLLRGVGPRHMQPGSRGDDCPCESVCIQIWQGLDALYNQERHEVGKDVVTHQWRPRPNQTDYVVVTSDDMEPAIPLNATITVDKSQTDPARLVARCVAVYQERTHRLTIKRLLAGEGGGYILTPDNLHGGARPFALSDDDRIIGAVTSVHTPFV